MQDIFITLTDGNLVSEPDVTKFHLTGRQKENLLCNIKVNPYDHEAKAGSFFSAEIHTCAQLIT